MHKISVKSMYNFSAEALEVSGVPQEQAELIADTIVYAHVCGKDTHGITRLPIYVSKIQKGLMSAETVLNIESKTPTIQLIDAADGFGQIAAHTGMSMCMDMAQNYGIGICGIRNSNNFGVAGYFSKMAVQNGMIGMVASASAPAIAPTGGNRAIFGTNPTSVGFPTPDGVPPIIFDMAASDAARGKIRLAEKNGEKIPFGWALDADGNPTDDPHLALLGTMLPVGGYKGYGIAMIVDLLAGLMTGNLFGGEIKNLNHKTEKSKHGHFLMALNIRSFMDYQEYLTKIECFIDRVKACGAKGAVSLPGERSAANAKKNAEYVQISSKVFTEMELLRENLHLDKLLEGAAE